LLTDKVFPQFIWDGPAQLIEEERNTAVIKGHIVNARNRSIGFDVFIKLVNQQDWAAWNAKGRTYTATTPEAILAAKRTHKTWTFWELGAGSYLKGTGELSGQIDLSKYPENNKTGFQLGTGANGWDKDLGLGGTFAYKGTIVQRGRKINFSGIGSINVDAELCKLQCTPLLTTAPRAALQQEELFAEAGNENLTIYPVPAHKQLSLSPGKLSAGMYTLIFYNNTGQLKKQQAVYLNKGNSNIAIDKLEPGMYILQLISSSGETTSKKLIIE
jgi:hypothetical protein